MAKMDPSNAEKNLPIPAPPSKTKPNPKPTNQPNKTKAATVRKVALKLEFEYTVERGKIK